MLRIVFMFAAICVTYSGGSELKGHLKPLGYQWGPASVTTPELDIVPQPREFYKQFVKSRQPVVFRGAAGHSNASRKWTTEYLESEYGDNVVRLEARHEQDTFTPVTEVGYGRDTIRHFARNFKKMNAYVISQIPQAMERDIAVPPCLLCGNFAESIQEVHVFITAKGGKTALHRDPFSNIHCVFNGTKDWILIGNEYEHLIYQSDESTDEFGGFSVIDVDSVDMESFPKILQVQHSLVTLNAGDCIYMPASYWHQVRVNGEYNTAVSIWFSREFKSIQQNWSNCDEENYGFKPLSEVKVLWRWSGKNGTIDQGRMDIHLLRALLLNSADAEKRINLEDFGRKFIVGDQRKKSNSTNMRQEFKLALGHGADYVTASQVRHMTVQKLKSLMDIIEPTDVSNTDQYEYSNVEPMIIRKLVIDLLQSSQTFSRDQFVESYMNVAGGSRIVGQKIFNELDVGGDEVVSLEEARMLLKDALKNFTSARSHDPSSERLWLRHMKEHDEL